MFKLTSQFEPTGDQPEAIKELTQGLLDEVPGQVLLGVTGSGKTFTIANVIQEVQRPTLILSHNKTLAAQLYGEFKAFFPENAVEYFVSYYDYYQPEAYLPTTNTYIEKDLMINDEIDKLRLRRPGRDRDFIRLVPLRYGRPDSFRLEHHLLEARTQNWSQPTLTPFGGCPLREQRTGIQTGQFPGKR